MFKKSKVQVFISSLIISGMLISSNVLATDVCQGELYSINSGKGGTGVLFSIDEEANSVEAESVAKYSSAAIAYDSALNRLYYVSSPIPSQLKVDVSELNIPNELMSQMPIEGKKFKYIRLAYYDLITKTHTVVGRTKSFIGMTYDAENDVLIGQGVSGIYSIDKSTGNTTMLIDLTDDISGRYQGDLVIKDNELYLVTSISVYHVERPSYELVKVADHGLFSATGATLSQNGELLISRTLGTDHGYANKSKLYQFNMNTGRTCEIATLPMRINDLATNTSSVVACYTNNPCSSESGIYVDGTSTKNYLEMPNAEDIFGNGTSFDISMNIKSTGGNPNSGIGLFSFANQQSVNEILIWADVNGQPKININQNSNGAYVPRNILDGEYHNLRVTWDSATGETSFYIDNLFIQTIIMAKGHTINSSHGILNLGQEQDSVGGRFESKQSFVGEYEDVQISVNGNLKAHWTMDSISDGEVSDMSGQGNNLVVHGTVTPVTHDN